MMASESALRSALSAGQQGEDARQWSWWAAEILAAEIEGIDETPTPEVYSLNEPTREAVIAAARREWGAAATIAIVEATQDKPFRADIFDEGLMQEISERFGEENFERWGEAGFDGYGCTEEQEQELSTALRNAFAAWLAKYGPFIPTFSFTATRHEELIRPEPAPEPAR